MRATPTEPLLLAQLHEYGVTISSGQLHALLTAGKERFHREKDEILKVGLRVSMHIHVDDTVLPRRLSEGGARRVFDGHHRRGRLRAATLMGIGRWAWSWAA